MRADGYGGGGGGGGGGRSVENCSFFVVAKCGSFRRKCLGKVNRVALRARRNIISVVVTLFQSLDVCDTGKS